MPRLAPKSLRVLGLAACLCMSHRVAADAPRDIQTNQRLWLDGLDVNGTDTGNGDGTNPGGGAQVTLWKDKSPNGFSAGDAVGYGAASRSYPTYSSNTGVSCNGINNVLQISGGIYGVATSVPNSDIFIVASTRSAKTQFLFYTGATTGSAGNRISANVPNADNILYWDHGSAGSPGRLTANWTTSGAQFNRFYVYNFGATQGSSQIIVRDGTTLVSATNSAFYSQGANHQYYICAGDTTQASHDDGVIAEMIVYSRRLNTAEKNILQSYLAAKHANPGGAGTASKYTVVGNFRYFVGGIGQESTVSLTTGTSAGLTITNGGFLANGNYLLAGVDSISPARGGTTADRPTGYIQRAQRVWYLHRTATGTPGNVTLTFNLSQIGVTVNSGATIGLGYRSAATGAFTALQAVTHNGANTVSFTVNNPSAGYYTLAIPDQLTYGLAATLSGTTANDFVNSANFKAIPGALIKATATVTNTGSGNPDSNSTAISIPIPADMKLYLGDIGPVGQGPIQFARGAVASGLSYSYGGLANAADGLEFSNNSGATWTYQPTADAQQADAAITHVRVTPSGTFNTGTSPNFPSFTVTYGLIIK